MSKIRVLIVDDDSTVREAIGIVLAEAAGPHPNFAETRAAAGRLQFDLAGTAPTDAARWQELRDRIARHGLVRARLPHGPGLGLADRRHRRLRRRWRRGPDRLPVLPGVLCRSEPAAGA